MNCEYEREVHLKCTHLQQVQYGTDLLLQVTFPAYNYQEKMGHEIRMNVAAYHE